MTGANGREYDAVRHRKRLLRTGTPRGQGTDPMKKLAISVPWSKRGTRRSNNNTNIPEYHPSALAELVHWTGRERLRALCYLLLLEIGDYHYASRRSIELRLGLPPTPAYRHRPRTGRSIRRVPRP